MVFKDLPSSKSVVLTLGLRAIGQHQHGNCPFSMSFDWLKPLGSGRSGVHLMYWTAQLYPSPSHRGICALGTSFPPDPGYRSGRGRW